MAPADASAALIGPSTNAASLAAAMTAQPGLVTSASWPALGAANPASASANGVATGFVGRFMPDSQTTFAAMTTGDVAVADPPNTSTEAGADLTTTARGVFDVSTLRINVSVPAGHNCLSLDGVYYSEEYPEYVGSEYNDAFVAELDVNDWSYDLPNNQIKSPHNFFFDDKQQQLTVNSTTFVSDEDTELQYDGSTNLLSASTTVTPGAHSLYLTIFDVGDHHYDSAMFLDNLRTYHANVACSQGASLVDTDNDGLLDSWETNGIDGNGDGNGHNHPADLDLPAMGADPKHKDIYVEADSMTNLALSGEAITRVVQSFANAPVTNPDGTTGIRMHVDNGPDSVMNPVTGAKWAARSGAETLPFQSVLGSYASGGQYDWAAFSTLKAAHLAANRLPAFHYLVSANRYGSASNGSSGISRGIGASDLIVSLGTACNPEGSCPGTLSQQAGTFMHEFGHNLGLHHNGDDDKNFNPEYLSIMNYLFQFTGLPAAGATSTSMTTSLDYSRYGAAAMGTLDEANLDENAGLRVPAGSPALSRASMYRCPNKTTRITALTGGVDFDCNGGLQNPLAADVNQDKAQTTLRSFDDWSNIQLKGGAIGGFGLDALAPQTTVSDEPTVAQLTAIVEQVTTPPTATTGDASDVTSSAATLSATVDPNGTPARYRFELGTTTAYGTTSPWSGAGGGSDGVAASTTVSALAADTTYHYRVVVETDRHLVYGADRTFTTTNGSSTPGPSGPVATQPTPDATTPIALPQQPVVTPNKPTVTPKKPCAGLKGKKRATCLRKRDLAKALRKCKAKKAGKARNACKAAARKKFGTKKR